MRGLARSHGRRSLVYLVNFGLGRGAGFLAPLALSAMLPPTVYGSVEFALSAATFVAVPAGIGISMAVPQMSLLRRPLPMADLLGLSAAIAAGGLVPFAAVAWWVLGEREAALGLLVGELAVVQGNLAAYFRASSRRNLTSWTDSSMVITTLCVVAAVTFWRGPSLPTIAAALAAYAVALGCAGAWASVRLRQPALRARFARALGLGAPLLAYTAAGVWISLSGRLLVGSLRGPADLAVFAFDFRVASLLLVVHALVGVGLYARVYRLRTRAFDRYASVYACGLVGAGVAVATAFPFVLPFIPTKALEGDGISLGVRLFPLLVAQTFGWSIAALLEGRLNRTRLAGKAALRVGVWAMGFAGALVYASSGGRLGLEGICLALVGQWFGMNAIQFATLAARGLPLKRLAGATLLGYAIALIWAVLRL